LSRRNTPAAVERAEYSMVGIDMFGIEMDMHNEKVMQM
jgi:hypothetical protein